MSPKYNDNAIIMSAAITCALLKNSYRLIMVFFYIIQSQIVSLLYRKQLSLSTAANREAIHIQELRTLKPRQN